MINVYTPTDCFSPFPFPAVLANFAGLILAVGESYYDFRAAPDGPQRRGANQDYNRFHDPYEHDPEIEQLRELHADMDRAVLTPTAGTTSRPTASSSSTTRSTRRNGAARRSPTATAGPTRSVTRCSRG